MLTLKMVGNDDSDQKDTCIKFINNIKSCLKFSCSSQITWGKYINLVHTSKCEFFLISVIIKPYSMYTIKELPLSILDVHGNTDRI